MADEDTLKSPIVGVHLGETELFPKDTPKNWKPEEPSESAILWKYMSFSKFMLLLHRKALFFPSVATMEDKFEGFMHSPQLSGTTDKNFHAARCQVHELLDALTKNLIINCWTESEHESSVMWKSYAGNEGIAIRTTYGDLIESLNLPKEVVRSGKVKYVEYNSGQIPRFNWAPLFHKRIEFKGEDEVRIVVGTHYRFDEKVVVLDSVVKENGGSYIPVDLDKLIGGIAISPYSDSSFKEGVSLAVEQASLNSKVVQSSI